MGNQDKKYPVPEQITGSKMDVVEKRNFNTNEMAMIFFESAANRLLKVNNWGDYAGGSNFQLIDKSGNKVERSAQEGDYIRIDIPGPGTHSGKGYDWVKIEEISRGTEKDSSFVAIMVRPTAYPLTQNENAAHFFEKEASSTFIVRREGLNVFAEEHGRNESMNVNEGPLTDRARNFVVGIAAKLGMSYPQWKLLVKGLLEG
jgi:hypothetical protein